MDEIMMVQRKHFFQINELNQAYEQGVQRNMGIQRRL